MKNLIIYFSWSGNTARLVEGLNREFNFDVVRLERKQPYSTDYDTCAYVEAKEEWAKRIHPEIKDLGVDVHQYDRILLFFPIWWYTFPMPVATLLAGLKDFKGEVILFENSYTPDPKYVETSLQDAQAIAGTLRISQGLFNRSVPAHIEFIKKLS